LVDVKKNPDRTRTFHWSMDQVFSSYLISMVVGDYAQIKDRVGDIDLEYNTYHKTESVVRPIFAKTPKMLRWYENVLGIPFPYKRYGQTIVASFIFGGMENITATTMADSEIMFSRPGDGEDSADELISHELSHSWFGDLVTCRDWSELWLNEGLATFMEASYAESEGGRPAYLKKLEEDQREYFAEDLADHRHPLVNRNYTTGMELFDTTTYKKGGFVIHMLRETVGDEAFWRSLHAYLEEFKYGNVTSADLEAVFERESGKDLTWFFKQWVYQAGAPDLVVQYHYDAGAAKLKVTVTQRQIADGKVPEVFRFPLEILITTAQGTKTVVADVNERSHTFVFDVTEGPSAVTVDPQMKVLKKVEVSRLTEVAPGELLIRQTLTPLLRSGK
jgi:aminopeptidase N